MRVFLAKHIERLMDVVAGRLQLYEPMPKKGDGVEGQ